MKIEKSTFEKHVQFFDRGAVIFREDDAGTDMYIIIQGLVEIRKATGSSSSKILTTLQKGDMFGEMAIIEKKPRSATAVAVEPTRVLSERIRRADAIIQNIMTTNRQNQLWTGLVQYARERGIATFKGNRVGLVEFTGWAVEHLGISEKDVQSILNQLLARKVISYSARGKDEIVIEPKDGVVLPDG
jgi:CRP/FNR family cyclic AMP-dependent transcriptional regulator